MSYAPPCTGINSIADNINTIQIGNFKLPGGFAGPYIFSGICQYLDINSFLKLIETSIIKQLIKEYRSDDVKEIINNLIQEYPERKLYLLIEKYRGEHPHGTWKRREIPTPLICACECGRMDDVKLFMNLHPYHKYITNRDANGYKDEMTLKDMVSQVGTDGYGLEYTPLMIAARFEHFHVVKYLIEKGEADTNIVNWDGSNALHLAAYHNYKNTKVVQLLLNNMPLDGINKMAWGRMTPLDRAYIGSHPGGPHYDSPIRREIIRLIRSKGGESNHYDENGLYIGDDDEDDYVEYEEEEEEGEGNGDLND